ncbi:MAG: ribose-phosphate pyrophosphokinase [Candidatus Dependentiae bacterium]|nr:ribose-phosphate pyrophosphokinase [Candidatus Dependentiae bacterium]
MNSVIVAPQSHFELAQKIAQGFGKQLIVPEITQFADGDIEVTFADYTLLRGATVFIVQSTNPPTHYNLMQFLLLVHAVKNAGAARIVGVVPYFGYARQDKSIIPGGKGAAELVARMIEAAGVDELVVVELHAPLVATFFSIPVHSVSVVPLLIEHIEQQDIVLNETCIVAPDHGAQDRALAVADSLKVGHIVFAKERYAADQTRIGARSGDCVGTTAIIIDDMIDTGGTALHVCDALREQGFSTIYGYFVHPVLSGTAIDLLEKSHFTAVYVANTISLQKTSPKIKQFDISSLIIDTLKNIK